MDNRFTYMKIRKSVLLIATMAIILALSSCSSGLAPNAVYSSDDLMGKTVGVIAGSGTEVYLKTEMENIYIRTCSDAATLSSELVSGEVDAVIADNDTAEFVLKKSSKLRKLDTPLAEDHYCIAVSQENGTLLNNLNSAIAALQKDGTLDSLYDSWFGGDGEYTPVSTSGQFSQTLTVAVSTEYEPYSFYNEDGEIAGYEIDLVTLICRELGVNAEFRVVSADKVLYMAESGKVNFSIGRITEGEESVLYSESYMTSIQNILVRKD